MNIFKLIRKDINSNDLEKAICELRMNDFILVEPMLEYQDVNLTNDNCIDGGREQILIKREQQRESDIQSALRISRRKNQLCESGYKMCEATAKAAAGLMVASILDTQDESANHLISRKAKMLISFYNLDTLTGEERKKAKQKLLSDIIKQRVLFDLINHRGNSIKYIINPNSSFDIRIQDALATYGFNNCLNELKGLISFLRVPDMCNPTKLRFESHLENGAIKIRGAFVEGYNYYEELHDKPLLRIQKKDSKQ